MNKYRKVLQNYLDLLKKHNNKNNMYFNKKEYNNAIHTKELVEAEYCNSVMLSRRIR